MKDKAKILIQNSKVLKEPQKAIYLKLLENLSKEDLQDFVTILEREKEAITVLEIDAEKQKMALNKACFEKIDQILKQDKATAIGQEERKDSEEADELLKQLEDL